jgi:protein XagA
MSLFKTFTRFSFFLLILFAASQTRVFADGGFPVRPGRLLIAPSVSYFFANTQWDSTGVKKAFPNGGKYTSVGVTLYAEYGISRRFAAVVSLPYVYNTYSQNIAPRNTVTSGLTDLETGIRYYLANINFVYYFSLQGTAITPMYSNNPSLGYGEEGGELKLAFSGTGTLFNRSSYFNASDGVRQYFGNNGPIQNRYTGTYGLALDNNFKNQLSVSISGINSFSDDKKFISGIPETNRNYSFVEASLSYGYSFTREFGLFATAGKFLTGRNTSDGSIFSLAFIYRLDYR